MSELIQAEILTATNAPGVYESGGKYGQKGVDFQRYWAISRILELVEAGKPDFVILFESLQDVVEFDSPTVPTQARVYQLKMKDTGEWTWKALTALPIKARKKKNSTEMTIPLPFTSSPIGKLACTLAELPTLHAEGVFVSNLGCSAEMEKGATAGSVRFCRFSELDKALRDQITPELAKLKKTISLDCLHLHRTELSVDDPDNHIAGKINAFLLKTAPKHAGQCRSFSDSLFATLSARGRKTDAPQDFAGLIAARGFCKSEFLSAVDVLCSTPDRQEFVNSWLTQLMNEKMPIAELTRLQVRVLQMQESRLKNGALIHDKLQEAAQTWVAANPVNDSIRNFLTAGVSELTALFPGLAREIVQAALFAEGINQCLTQI